jgi:Tol biopolymer transport system component/DNA-binding winged helix-turn-helix (wHTH) protein
VGLKFAWDSFLLDLDAYRLERSGMPVPLEPKAFNLLALMIRRPGHLFTKQEIFDAVWPGTSVTDHALTRVIAQLRKVLGDEAREPKYLETVPTRGYRWIRPVEEVAEAGNDAASKPARHVTRTVVFAAAAVLVVLVWFQQKGLRQFVERALGSENVAAARSSTHAAWPVQLTTHDGLDMQPALSPQGDAVAFASDRSGSFEIYVRTLSGGGIESPLTRDGGQNVQPAWSPDGSRLAYHSVKHGGIWVVPSRGGTAVQVAPVGSSPAWSPDGRRLAFQSDEYTDASPGGFGAQSGSTIRLVDADGERAVAPLTRSGQPIGGHASPAWSPDGRYLAFSVFDSDRGNQGVWVLTIATGRVAPLLRGKTLYETVFAPDTSTVYIAGGEAMILRVAFDAATGTSVGTPQLIPVAGVSGVRSLTMSRDGRQLGFAGVALSSQIWAQSIDSSGNASGSAVALTSDTSRRNSFPALSPDGTKVAYMSTRRGELPNVWVMERDGSRPVQLTSDETADFRPDWLLDGRHVVYSSRRGTSAGIWSADISTRRERPFFDRNQVAALPDLGGGGFELALSPSATQAAFAIVTAPEGRRILYTSRMDRRGRRAITDGHVSVGYPAWSPDERSIAVEIKDGSSMHAGVIDADTGALRRLSNERGQTWVRSWSPDGRKIAAASLRDGTWSLQWLAVDSDARGTIAPPAQPRVYYRYPDWSPRGDLVVFERGEVRGNIWMLPIT